MVLNHKGYIRNSVLVRNSSGGGGFFVLLLGVFGGLFLMYFLFVYVLRVFLQGGWGCFFGVFFARLCDYLLSRTLSV